MALLWGARAVTEDSVVDYESMVDIAITTCRDELKIRAGGRIVVLSGVPFGQSGSTNNIRVATLS